MLHIRRGGAIFQQESAAASRQFKACIKIYKNCKWQFARFGDVMLGLKITLANMAILQICL